MQRMKPIKKFVIRRSLFIRRLLGICFWREGFEGAFGPERTGEKGGYAGGLDFFEGIGDPFGDFWRKEIGVSGVGHGTEAVVHGAGRGVGVGGGDEDVFGGNSGGLESKLLGLVADVAGDHAAIDDGDRDESLIATEDEATGLEIAGVHLAAATFGEATIDEEGVEGRGDVLNVSSGFEGRFSRRGVIGREPEPKSKKAAEGACEESGG